MLSAYVVAVVPRTAAALQSANFSQLRFMVLVYTLCIKPKFSAKSCASRIIFAAFLG